ncbi:MAG TPA: translocation/assembly module TamB domain-containing protein [Gemmatimonadaceae bacterium]|nr:translocation/assembly module TamB domain-containing protein [Gemmatimonadaceae bacterium]
MARRLLIIGIAFVVLVIATAFTGVVVFTNTDYGRERVRQLSQSLIQKSAKHGVVRLGKVSGNLLEGFRIADVSIRDSTGAPFLVADTVGLNYGLRAVFLKRLELTDVRLVRPLIVLDKPPGDSTLWNYKAIFKSNTPAALRDTTKAQFGDWIVLRDVTVLEGRMAIRTPWKPGTKYTGTARDSVIEDAVSGKLRPVVERRGAGFQKVIEFRNFNGQFPYLRLAQTDTKVRRLEIAKLSVTALPFHPPAAIVNNFIGALEFTSDSIWFKDAHVWMPGSKAAAEGRYVYDTNEFDLVLRGQPFALADARFVMPQVPAKGEAVLDFRLRWRGDTSTYVARKADIRIDSTHVSGDFAVSMVGDSLWFHDTDMKFALVDTHLIEQLVPTVKVPRHGTLSGSAKLDGPPGLLNVDGNVAFDDARYGRSRVIAVGAVGTTGTGVRFRNFDVTFDPVQVAMARVFVPSMPLGGTLRGSARVNGSTDGQMVVRADVTHDDAGARSRLAGNATMRLGSRPWFDVDARLLPLSLTEVNKLAPAAGLQGTAAGPVRLTGDLGNLRLDSRLVLADGGRLDTRGTLDLASKEKGYDLSTQMRVFNARSVAAKAPATSLTATAFARGRGFAPATMQASFGATLATSTIDTVAIDSANVRVAIANGVVQVATASVSGPHTAVTLGGSFGLADGATGQLDYRVEVDSLAALNRFFPAADTGAVPPRPRGYSRIVAQAQADSAAVARATEIERLATGAAAPKLGPIPAPPAPIRRDSTAGRLFAAGTIRGGIKNFDIRGRAGAEDVVFRGSSLRRARLEYAWAQARTPGSKIAVAASLDSVRAAGFAMDSVEIRSSVAQQTTGDIAFVIYQQTGEEYSAGADFALHKDHNEMHVRDLALRFDSTRWVAAHPASVRWGSNGIVVDRLELKNNRNGRLFVDGNVPPEGAGGLDIVIENFQAADLAALTQTDLEFRGLVSTTARIEGTMAAPRFRAALGIANATYAGAAVPDLRATATYAAPALNVHLEVADSGRRVAVGDGRIAMNIGSAAGGPLLPDAPIAIDVQSEGIPLGLVSRFTDAVEDVRGRAYGVVRVRGTTKHPTTVGALALQNGGVRLAATGMRLTGVYGSIRLLTDSVIIDSIAGNAGGRIVARGGVGIKTLSEPSFDLKLTAQNARLLDNDQGTVRADVGLSVQGPFNRTYVTGRVGVRSGVIIIPESDHKEVISTRDPALYSVVDTATSNDAEDGMAAQSPLMANLRMDVNVDIDRDTWVRTADANVEIFTPPDRGLAIHVDRRRQAIVLDGEVSTDRGEYEFLSKRFQIRRGSAVFVGGQGKPDPNLQITAEYEVRLAASEAINLRVQIGGTLSRPRISLDSDAQPPLSQSDLLSYLAFGRTSSSLLQVGGSSLTGGGGGSGNLAGAGAQLATQQLAAVALGVFVSEFEGQAARSLGAAYVNVTPADLYTELAGSGEIAGFFKGTEVEIGKYTDPNTFVALQARLSSFASDPKDRAVPGIRVQRRLGKGFSLDASFTPRYIPQAPTLETKGIAPKSTGVFGTFLAREWKF